MGRVFLIGAVTLGIGGCVAELSNHRRGARWAMATAASALVLATGVLITAIATLDFSYEYVASQSRARSSGAYRLAALWGGAEGSLLFFAVLFAIVASVAAWRYDLGRWGLAASCAMTAVLAATVAFAANPFARAPLPAVRGAGLTPILEHPAMLYHPPILYLGLVATLVPFALAIDGPVVNPARRAIVRRWILGAWTLLTVGLATGANWAYVELGWGGYWAWDPVENTVLMPWLVLTAAMHLLRSPQIVAAQPRLITGAATVPFVLVLFGATVTRSGGLSSVHAFADAEALGWSLGLLTLAVGCAVLLRLRADASTPQPRARFAGVGWFVIAAAALAVFMAIVVMMGVAVPLLPGSNRIVTADFYNRVGTPVLVVALFAMLVFPIRISGNRRQMVAAVGGAAVLAVLLGQLLDVDDWLRWVVLLAGSIIVVAHLVESRQVPGATMLAHIGFVILAFGVASSAQAETVATVLAPGESVEFGSGQVFIYESFAVTDGPRPRSEAVVVQARVTDLEGRLIVRVQPALVSYPDRGVALAETSLHSTPARDVQVVLRTVTDEGLGSFEISERPTLMLVWWGAALIALAGLIGVTAGARRGMQRTVSRAGVDTAGAKLGSKTTSA